MGRKAVFLDRDGVITRDTGYVGRVSDLRLLPNAAKAIRRLREAGFLILVISNQSGVARGFFDEADLRAVTDAMTDRLRRRGAAIDGIYYCPHHPEGVVSAYRVTCACRKPAPGLFLQAAEDHDIDLGGSYVIGNEERDIVPGLELGCRAILVGKGAGVPGAAHVANLGAAADFILGGEK